MKQLSIWIGAGTIIAVAAMSMAQGQNSAKAMEGKRMPAFTMTTVDGKTLDSKSTAGKVVLIDFWATWCGPCKELSPGIQKLHETYASKGLTVIGAATSDRNTAAIKRYPTEHKYTFTFTLGDANDKLAKEMGVTGLPTIFVIDKQGVVRHVEVGSSARTIANLEDAIKKLL